MPDIMPDSQKQVLHYPADQGALGAAATIVLLVAPAGTQAQAARYRNFDIIMTHHHDSS